MESSELFMRVGTSLGLGLLVGLQRERAKSATAGIRTFAIVSLLGAVCGVMTEAMGAWLPAAGLIGVAVLALIGNLHRDESDRSPGVTTEAAMLLMFAVGVLATTGPLGVAVAVGAVCAIALHLKEPLHGFVRGLDDKDIHAMMQFAAISLIILPIVPDREMGPFNSLNPRNLWMMVVLVVGISLAGYVAYRVMGQQRGTIVAGLLGGLISSTATTASFARRAAANTNAAGAAAMAILLASSVVYVRVLVEIYSVSPDSFRALVAPIAALMGVSLFFAFGIAFWSRRDPATLGEIANPTQLKGALFFAAMYALVLVAAAAANHWFGHAGIYGVAAISGLTDLDAITLSSSDLMAKGQVTPAQGGTAIVIALISNTLFKTGMAAVLGGRALLMRLLIPALGVIIASVVVIVVWLPMVGTNTPEAATTSQVVAPP